MLDNKQNLLIERIKRHRKIRLSSIILLNIMKLIAILVLAETILINY
jgi:hypothetical protein